jgi:membrane protein YdbS with pleckstrin-like domain
MPIGAQPRGARGTVGHPYSALNLRLVLAAIGLVLCAAASVVLFWRGVPVLGALFAAVAATAVVDIVVIQLRRRARHRTEPTHHSLFE